MTDKYHFTTALGYWHEGRADNPSVFYMFGRREALSGGYTVAAGLEGIIDIVERWQQHGFSDSDIDYLRSQQTVTGKQQFPEGFLDYLKNAEFKLKIDAVKEGGLFFPQEPVLRVEGPVAQVKMLESVALCLMNGHSAYTTQAARQQDVLSRELENGSPTGSASVQGLRRGPGFGAALEASRSLGLGGYTSSSTGVAAKDFGQVFAGTMDHAWVMTHENELGDVPLAKLFELAEAGNTAELQDALKKDAFRSFAFAHPESGILLVDTYDPLQGLENAITTIKELHALGLGQKYGVRFDSGDIVKYSKIALRRFAEEGFIEGLDRKTVDRMSYEELLQHSDKCSVFCAAADGIDEHSAQKMREDGAFFSSWGIGTGGSHVAPVGLVYKASSIYMGVLGGQEIEQSDMTPVMKVASNAPVKSSNPGKINSRRYYEADGTLSHVVLYDETLGLDAQNEIINLRNFGDHQTNDTSLTSRDLLVPVFDAEGRNVYEGLPQKESFPGSGKQVTDLLAVAKSVKSELATLPEGARVVAKPQDDVLKDKLLTAFKRAQKDGVNELSVDVAALVADLPPEVQHVPVYLDANLFRQRVACEEAHLAHANKSGVGEYHERFEGEAVEAAPGTRSSGNLQVVGAEAKRVAAR